VSQLQSAFLLFGFYLISHINPALATDPIDLGRSIYEKGIGRDDREINAIVHGSVSLQGAAIACMNCHGIDARGGGEAFVQVPDIRWLNLSKPYPARRMGAAEAPYDPSSFSKALRAGITAADRKLDPIMPRFDLTDDEINSLIAYLNAIDRLRSLGQARLVILGLLPKPGRSTLADSLNSKLKSCPANENGSPVAAVDMLYFDTPGDALVKLHKRLAENPNTLILTPFLLGWEHRYAQAMQRYNDIPTALPFSLLNPPDESNWIFPFPGLESQILALLKSAKAEGYTQLRIHSEPENFLSVKLATVAIKMAATHGMLVIADKSEKTHKPAKIATLWLKQFNPNQVAKSSSKDELMLVPVMFLKPDQANKDLQGNSLPQQYIAYPYNPKIGKNETWRMPIDVWADAACQFLSLVGEKLISLNELPEILKWKGDLFLYSRPNLDLLSDRVFIHK